MGTWEFVMYVWKLKALGSTWSNLRSVWPTLKVLWMVDARVFSGAVRFEDFYRMSYQLTRIRYLDYGWLLFSDRIARGNGIHGTDCWRTGLSPTRSRSSSMTEIV